MTNFYTSLLFLGEMLAAAGLYRWLAPRLSASSRAFSLILISLFFLAQLKAGTPFLIATSLYATFAALVAYGFGRFQALKQGTLKLAGIILLAALLLLLVKYRFYASLLLAGLVDFKAFSVLEWLGLSYMTFRAIDLWVQARRAKIAPAPFTAAAYLVFFPAFVAGPVNRFRDFANDLAAPPTLLSFDELRAIAERLGLGVIKILLLAEFFRANSPIGLASPEGLSPTFLMIGLFCQLAYIYFDFSGYSDGAIATARLFGLKLPENFNHPYLARNLQDFWNRWHISFVHWCRDYIYFVLLRSLRLRARWMGDLGANLAAIFTTFFFMGAWHGDGLNWLLYGVYHGLGMAGLVVGRRWLATSAPDLNAKLADSRIFGFVSVLATLSFVSVGLLLTHDITFAKQGAAILVGL
ncbi:MAG: MBOAT family protein [Alphaproteobacteria bacterium]|nr:MBOAT family protein [Alphaproteobacteria bacterium]